MNTFHVRAGAMAVTAALLFAGASPADAQSKRLGLRGGASFATVTTDLVDSDTRTGFTVGAFADFPLSEFFSIEPGVNYVTRGGEFENEGFPATELELDYIEIPVLFKANIVNDSPVTPHLYAGPALSFEVDCTLTEGGDDVDAVAGCDEQGFDFFTRGTSIGLMAGGGASFAAGGGTHLALDVLYNAGLTSIDDSDTNAPEFLDVKNRTLTVTASFSIPVGPEPEY